MIPEQKQFQLNMVWVNLEEIMESKWLSVSRLLTKIYYTHKSNSNISKQYFFCLVIVLSFEFFFLLKVELLVE